MSGTTLNNLDLERRDPLISWRLQSQSAQRRRGSEYTAERYTQFVDITCISPRTIHTSQKTRRAIRLHIGVPLRYSGLEYHLLSMVTRDEIREVPNARRFWTGMYSAHLLSRLVRNQVNRVRCRLTFLHQTSEVGDILFIVRPAIRHERSRPS